MTRRRTCPICKGDVVRSLNQRSRAGTTESSHLPIDVEDAAPRHRARRHGPAVQLPVEYAAEDGLPIMTEYDGDDEIDLERGLSLMHGPPRRGRREADGRSLWDSFGVARES